MNMNLGRMQTQTQREQELFRVRHFRDRKETNQSLRGALRVGGGRGFQRYRLIKTRKAHWDALLTPFVLSGQSLL